MTLSTVLGFLCLVTSCVGVGCLTISLTSLGVAAPGYHGGGKGAGDDMVMYGLAGAGLWIVGLCVGIVGVCLDVVHWGTWVGLGVLALPPLFPVLLPVLFAILYRVGRFWYDPKAKPPSKKK
jgi:hypothetical protein